MHSKGKLMDMLVGYAASHQHPVNVFMHMIGIPAILLGVLIPMTFIGFEVNGFHFYLAHVVAIGFVAYYLTLDVFFAGVFAVAVYFLIQWAAALGDLPGNTGWTIAGACFFGGYILQFAGHAIEKSMPVLVKHPIQANLAAPFFVIVELFKITGIRGGLFDAVKLQIAQQRDEDSVPSA